MKKLWQFLATFVLVAALAVSGHAGPGNGNGGDKGNKPNKELKQNGNNADKQAEKEARKAEKEARKLAKAAEKEAKKLAKAAEKALKQAEKEARKAAKQAEKEARKAAKNAGTNTSLTFGEIIVTDSRIVDLTGDYLLETVLINGDGTTSGTSVSLSLVQDGRGELVGTSLITLPDGSTVEFPVLGNLELSGQTDLSLHIEGALEDETASLEIDGTWDGSAFQSVVTVTDFEEVITYDAVIIPVNPVVGFIIEAPLTEEVIGNKIWSDRNVVLPWGNEVVRSQHMNKKGFKFMMHSGNFGIDLRGSADELGVVDLSRAKLHLGYGSLELDPATIEILTIVE